MPGENPFAKYAPAAGPVYGPPPDPTKAAAETRAVEDQQFQRATEARRQAEWKAAHNPDGSEKPKIVTDGKPTEFQAKSAGFLGRMLDAEGAFGAVPEGSRDPRSLTGQPLHDWAPGMENTLPTFMGGNSADRQKADQAETNFIAASLRLRALPRADRRRARRFLSALL